jgi:hypothetical protein
MVVSSTRCRLGRIRSPEYLVDAAWWEIVVVVLAAVAIGAVQAPFVGADVVAELRDAHLGPFGQVGLPEGEVGLRRCGRPTTLGRQLARGHHDRGGSGQRVH